MYKFNVTMCSKTDYTILRGLQVNVNTICDRICEKVPFSHIFQNLFFVIKAFV